jgi:hypothetical protein
MAVKLLRTAARGIKLKEVTLQGKYVDEHVIVSFQDVISPLAVDCNPFECSHGFQRQIPAHIKKTALTVS